MPATERLECIQSNQLELILIAYYILMKWLKFQENIQTPRSAVNFLIN